MHIVFYDSTTFWTRITARQGLRSVAGLVIQATGRTEFEDDLRTGVLLGGCWCPWGGRTYPRINFNTLRGCRSWVGCGCQKDHILDQIPTCLVPQIGGIELQLLYGVRIELAQELGSLFVSQVWLAL